MSEANVKPPIVAVEGALDTPEKIVTSALNAVQSLHDNCFDGRCDIDDPARLSLNCLASVHAFGVAVLMETLRRMDPEVATRAATVLWGQWDDGSSPGENVWVWRQEQERGEHIDQGGYVFRRILDSRSSS